MKKARIGKTALVAALIMCFTALFTTCKNNIGLGGQIDILPPIGEITYPDGGGAIRGSFDLKGKANDDDGIQSISVVFKNIKTKQMSQVYDVGGFIKGSASVEWTVHIDNEANENGYNIPDGEYEAIVTVTDKGGKPSTITKNYKIDNRPPQIEILSPDLSKNQSGDFTMRGSVIDIPSGVKSIKYIVGKQDSSDITKKPDETTTEWKAFELSGDTWAITFTDADNITQKAKAESLGKKVDGLATGVELYDIPLFFLVEDKAGNVGIVSHIIRVDPNGDIPEITVRSPDADKVLGGTIRIWGTVSVPNPAAGVVKAVMIQITDKVDASDKPDFSESAVFGGTDWCPSEGKQLSYTEGSPYWSVEINKSKEFDASSGTQRVIWFRLRGKNDKNIAGQWTAPIKVTIDKAAPTITGMKVATGGNINTPIPSWPIDPENQDYVSNMWIKGDELYLCADLSHDAGIERIDISGTYLTSPVSLTGNSEITGYKLHNQQCFEQDGHNYKMRIPLKTTANPTNNNGFTINVTIKAKKQKQGDIDGLTASTSFSFKYDNSKPTAVFGTKIYSSGIVTVSGTSFTDYALKGKTNISTSMKLFTSGEDIEITAFDKNTGEVTLASAPANPTKGYLIYSPIEYLKPDTSGKVWVSGAAYDVGAGVEKVKVKYDDPSATEVVLEFPSGVQTDVGNGDANFVTWKGELNVNGFADGTGKIVITPIDRANNAAAPIKVPVKLKKEPLKISAVALGTDMNRNGAIADVGSTVVETKTLALTYNAANPDGIDSEKYDWHGKADGGTFRFKNNTSHIKIGTGGGSGAKKYTLKCVTNGTDIRDLTALPSDGVITLNAADFTKIGQSDDLATSDPKKRKLLLTVWDSAQGLTCGTDTWMAELELDVIVDTKDRVAPTNTIDPFKWTSESENSLYGNSRNNGHIEIGTDLPSTFNQATGLMDKDDKVSGKISITGTAHDDQVITGIWAKIDDFTFTGVAGAVLGGETKLAVYNAANGTFTVESGNVDTNGWKFTVVSNEFSVEKGHTVKWQLDWDSSKITNGVGLDKTITVTVKDTAQTNTAFDSRKVDVVPYITEIVTEKTHESGLTKNTIRSSDGKYSVIKGSTVGFIKVKGFNLSNPTVRLVKAADLPTATETTGEGLTATGSGSEFTLTNALSKSGYLEVFAGASKVRAINNINSNEKAYNKEEDLYLLKNKNFNDDRYLRLFDMKQTAVRNGYYPEMIMDGNDPVFGYIDLSGGPDSAVVSGGAGAYQPSHAMPQRAKFNGATGSTTDIEYLIKASIWDQMGMARDDGGRYHHVTVYDRDKCAMSFIYDRYAELYDDGKGWGAGVQYARYETQGGNLSTRLKNNALTLETTHHDSLLLGRYQYPKIITKGNSITDKAVVYMAYYDANTNDKKLIFRNFQIGKKDSVIGIDTGSSPTKFELYSDSSHPEYVQWTNLKENYTTAPKDTKEAFPSPDYNTGRLELVTSASPYFDIGVLSDGRVVVVYFDESVGKLKLRYSNAPVTGDDPTAVVAWTDSSIEFPNYVGQYVSMDIDSSNGIHIAAFDSNNGDLKYFYLDSYNATTLKTALVDAAFSVGQWTQIKVHNNKPYIAYYNNSEAGQRSAIKLAVAKDNVGTVMTVPTLTPAQGGTPKFKKVNLGFDTDGRPVVGYLGSNIEFGKWLDE